MQCPFSFFVFSVWEYYCLHMKHIHPRFCPNGSLYSWYTLLSLECVSSACVIVMLCINMYDQLHLVYVSLLQCPPQLWIWVFPVVHCMRAPHRLWPAVSHYLTQWTRMWLWMYSGHHQPPVTVLWYPLCPVWGLHSSPHWHSVLSACLMLASTPVRLLLTHHLSTSLPVARDRAKCSLSLLLVCDLATSSTLLEMMVCVVFFIQLCLLLLSLSHSLETLLLVRSIPCSVQLVWWLVWWYCLTWR